MSTTRRFPYVELNRQTLTRLIALATITVLTAQASALTFSYHYDERDRPEFDPNGTKLRTVTEAAMDIWSDYILDGGNLEFDLSWEAPTSM